MCAALFFRAAGLTDEPEVKEPVCELSDDEWEARFIVDWRAFCVKHDVSVRIRHSVRRRIQDWRKWKRHERPQSVEVYTLAPDHWAVPGIGKKTIAVLSHFAAQEWPGEGARSIE